MRLSPEEVATIKAAALEAFGPTAIVRLFGSRVDDARRGGDTDLHVEVDRADPFRRAEMQFRGKLWSDLNEMPIDVVVRERAKPPRWIDHAAYRDGILL